MEDNEQSVSIDWNPCKTCQKLIAKGIGELPDGDTCDVAMAAFGGICAVVTAETVWGPVVCAVAAVILTKECNRHGLPWIKQHRKEVAAAICVQAHLCWSLTEEGQTVQDFNNPLGITVLTPEELKQIRQRFEH